MIPSMLVVWLLQLIMLKGYASSEVCGQPKNSPRIVGGQPAVDGSWPWQVSITIYNYHICGGSLIGKQWVLSAAHCFTGSAPFSKYNVILGAHNLSDLSSHTQISSVEKIIIPSIYTGAAGSSGDIALVKLTSPVKYTDYIMPICLPNSNMQFAADADCWITGWGKIKSNVSLEPPYTLQEAKVQLINQEICIDMYNFMPQNPIKDDMFCAGFPGSGKDSCQGDSGGPLVCKLKEGWTQAGIVSWGIDCAHDLYPGVYTSVPFYAKWIETNGNSTVSAGWESIYKMMLLLLFLHLLTIL